LIHASGDTHVWAESYNRDLSDVNSLQSELAQTIAKQVGATTSVSGKLERRIKPEAHDAYLLGRVLLVCVRNRKKLGVLPESH
jgi:hypothetical protein